MVGFAHFEKALLGADADRVVEKPPQQPAPEAPAPGRLGHRQVEKLRFARREHQHAVRDDALVELADQRPISRGEGVAEIPRRPRGRVRGLLELRDDEQVFFAHRAPCHRRADVRFDTPLIADVPRARSALVSATL